MNKYSKCESCIKEDVCSFKENMSFVYEQIMTVNTSKEDNTVHYARDNKNIDVTVFCKKFAPKDKLLNTTVYRSPVCKGSYLLGSACGHCEKCAEERNNLQQHGVYKQL